MTAETLKPFITPTSENGPTTVPATRVSRERNNKSRNSLVISLCTIALMLTVVLLGVTIWNSMRVCNLETEVKNLNRVIESMQKRLGLNYLDDLQDFEKEYQNALLDNPSTLDDIEGADDDEDDDDDEDEDDVIIPNNTDEDDEDDDDDDDEDYGEIDVYDELMKKYSSYDDSEGDDEENNSNLSDNDNLYDDFEKFKDSKKKNGIRKSRSIAHVPKVQQQETTVNQINKTENNTESKEQTSTVAPTLIHYRNHKSTSRPQALHLVDKQKSNFVAQRMEEKYSPLRQPNHRRRQKFPMIKRGESLLSAKSTALRNTLPSRPAAHFHLNRRIPDRHSTTKIDSYTGDMYIGHAGWPNELDTENYFQLNNGVLIVRAPGLYYVYAQVCYNNTHDQNGFVIFHGHKPFLQCLNTVPTNMPLKIHTCHTSGLLYLQANEAIHLRDFHADRNVVLKETNNRSYFGLIKI